MKILIGYLLIVFILASSVAPNKISSSETKAGKAWWYVTYTLLGSKKLYISKVFNNDCNHCCNEIREAYKKHLVMQDYDLKASTVYMSCLHDVKEEDLNNRRDEEIYKRKQQGFSVIEINFSSNP